jgi:alpha-beta hydrolase superfamily lysophospholipase
MKLIFFTLFLVTTLFSNAFKTLPLKTSHHEATLIYQTVPDASKAILYIHGFNDYFFNEAFAQKFIENGYSFFAIDLHHYGRNLTPNSKPYYFQDIKEFDEEISLAIRTIKKDFNIQHLTLYGYSQGALIATLYAYNYNTIDRLILDSAFFDFYFDPWIENIALPVVAFLGKWFPTFKISSTSPNVFAQSLHQSFNGEWEFDLNLKSTHTNAPIYLGWIHAIYEAQQIIHNKIDLNIPVLSVYSNVSYKEDSPKEWHFKGDIVLDVKDIKRYSNHLNANASLTAHKVILDAMHGVTFSKELVRQKAYDEIFNWLKTTN